MAPAPPQLEALRQALANAGPACCRAHIDYRRGRHLLELIDCTNHYDRVLAVVYYRDDHYLGGSPAALAGLTRWPARDPTVAAVAILDALGVSI